MHLSAAYVRCANIWENCDTGAFPSSRELTSFHFVAHFYPSIYAGHKEKNCSIYMSVFHVPWDSWQGETQDLLFIATERYKFCVLQWDTEASEVITRSVCKITMPNFYIEVSFHKVDLTIHCVDLWFQI